MIGSVIRNSSINTKMHAKMRGTLTEHDYERLTEMKSVPEVAEFLKNETRFGSVFGDISVESIHRGQLEGCLRRLIMQDLQSFLAFTGTSAKFFLSLFAMREEISYIKLLLRLLHSGDRDEHGAALRLEGEFYNNIDFTALANAESIDSFIEMLKPTVYGKALIGFRGNTERQNLFEIELALDSFYRRLVGSYMAKYLPKPEAETVSKTFDAECELADIMFIIRAKTYYKLDSEMIYPHISIKNGGPGKNELTAMIEAVDDAALKEAVRATKYGELFEGTEIGAESRIERYILKLHRKMFRRNPYSIEAILYYIKLKETEIKNIIMITEGIRYGLEPEKIKGYLIPQN